MQRKFHLNKRDGKLMGVCAGLADYTGIDALWIRLATALAVLAGFGTLILVYIAIGLIASDRPPAFPAFEGCRPVFAGDERDHWRGDVETYYSASNPRLSRQIDDLG